VRHQGSVCVCTGNFESLPTSDICCYRCIGTFESLCIMRCSNTSYRYSCFRNVLPGIIVARNGNASASALQ
jgi:hypothetical protein